MLMRLVVDASTLVAEALRKRGRELLANPALELLVAADAWGETQYELAKRTRAIAKAGRLSISQAEGLLSEALDALDRCVMVVPQNAYAHQLKEAQARVLRDPRDAPTVALALATGCPIWTGDKDFFGCGVPVWDTDSLLRHIDELNDISVAAYAEVREGDSPFAEVLPFSVAGPGMLSTVAHELRGPLAALVTSAELLVEDHDSLSASQMNEMLGSMHRGALWLHALVENLLCAVSIRDGRFQLHPQSVAMEDLIEQVLPVVSPLMKRRGQSLEVSTPQGLPILWVDARRIGQVLVNLIGNASKFAEDRSAIKLIIDARSDRIRVAVADRGPGLPTRNESELFEPFHRAASATHSSKQGVGLGLSVVRSLIEAHDGRVGAENRRGGGACFWFELPVPTHLQTD
jgi:signal transduction histidine kinase